MKLSRVKIAVLVMALLVGLAVIPAFAACPPGTIDLGTNMPAGGDIVNAGTYCVPATGVTLGNNLTIKHNGVTIVGEVPDATLKLETFLISINAGVQHPTIQNVTLATTTANNATYGIQDNGGYKTVIQGVTFEDNATKHFTTAAVELNGQDPTVKYCTFKMPNSNVPAIKLAGGMGAVVEHNSVQGTVTGTGAPTFLVNNTSGGPYNDATISNNTINNAGGLIGAGGTPHGYSNSTITDNIAGKLGGTGINLAGDSTNTQVLRNVFTYGVVTATSQGIIDSGGSNNQYSYNRITADPAKATGDGIQFGSSNATITGNTIDATGNGTLTGSAIDAISSGTAASNATITDNTILGASADGVKMTNNSNTSFNISDNTFSNIGGKGIDNAGGGTSNTISHNTFTTITGIGIDSAGNNTIDNNTLTGVSGGGIKTGANDKIYHNTLSGVTGSHGIDVAGTNSEIVGNTISNVSGGNHGINLAASNCHVYGNTIDTVSGGGDGILLAADNETIGGNGTQVVPAAASTSSVPEANTIKNILTGGVGINVQSQSNNKVVYNTIESVKDDGILVTGGMNNDILDNKITGAAQDATTASPYAGIHVNTSGSGGNITNVKIDGNTVTNAGSTTYAVGIDVDQGTSTKKIQNCEITNNTVSGFTTVDGKNTSTAIGIKVKTDLNCSVSGNTVSNSGNMRVGIEILTQATFKMPVTNNTIEGMADIGLQLRGGTVDNPLLVQGNILNNDVTGLSLESGAADIVGTDAATKNTVSGGATAVLVTSVGNAANFKVHGNCFDAPVLARNDGLGALDATGNYWAATPVPGSNVFGEVDVSGALSSCPGSAPAKTHTYGATAGWYMVSVPLNTGTASDLFSGTAYTYDPATGQYVVATNIVPTKGYWVTLPAGAVVTDHGVQVTNDETIDVSTAGWYQISAPWSYPKSAIQVVKGSETKSWADAVAAGWVADDIYGYTAVDGAYTTPSTLNPWYGYWMKAEVDGLSLKLAHASGTPVSAAAYAPKAAPMAIAPADLPAMPVFTASALGLTFGNSPNPVTDVHTTYFSVKGAAAGMVEAVKVEIYDLAGTLVYSSGEVAGTSLAWHTDNDYGEYLANGTYKYVMSAKVNGQWVVSTVKPVVILR